MYQSVQTAVVAAYRLGQSRDSSAIQARQIAGNNDGVGIGVLIDPIKNRFELTAGTTQQNNVGAEARQSLC